MAEAARRFHGSCHCKAVRFTAEIDFSAGTTKCNCTWCWKMRRWNVVIGPTALEALGGSEHLSLGDRGGFCRRCGVGTYAILDTTGWDWGDGGDVVSINVACLDDLDVETLAAAPVTYQNGLDDDWWHPPTEVRHL